MRPGRAARPLAAKLIADGFDVVSLSRRPAESPHLVPGAVAHLAFDPADPGPWQDAIDGARAVVALGGAPFFRKWASWEEFERVGTGGRVVANRALVSAIERASRRPEVYVTASAVGYYGFIDSDEIITESSPAGPDKWAMGTVAWETEAMRATELGVRVVVGVRTGIVLSPTGGMAAQMAPQFRRGFGAIILPGTQWLPWIHIDDEVAMALFALAVHDERVTGGLNASAPNPARFVDYAARPGSAHATGARGLRDIRPRSGAKD